jgi:hypothetical protein
MNPQHNRHDHRGHRQQITAPVPEAYFPRNYLPLDGDLTAGPLLLPGFPGILEAS